MTFVIDRGSTTGQLFLHWRTAYYFNMIAATSLQTAELDSASSGLTCSRQTALPTKCATFHTHVEINLIKKGSVTYLYGGSEIRAGAGRLVTFWAAIPHQIVGATADAEYYVMTIPLTWFLQCRLPEGFTHLVLNGQVLVDPQEISRVDFDMFERWIVDLRLQQPAWQRMVLLEVEARLLRFAVGLAAQNPSAAHGHDTTAACDRNKVDRIRQMLCFIAQNYTEQITVELISKSVGYHPNYAMNLFRKTFGTTLVNYVTRHRVSHAQRLLATSDQKVVDVAMSSGFNSLSRFNDAFKKTCGCSPREYRERCHNVSFN
jgi:AraC family transcriptional regulator, melibiose operon regulatory protein